MIDLFGRQARAELKLEKAINQGLRASAYQARAEADQTRAALNETQVQNLKLRHDIVNAERKGVADYLSRIGKAGRAKQIEAAKVAA